MRRARNVGNSTKRMLRRGRRGCRRDGRANCVSFSSCVKYCGCRPKAKRTPMRSADPQTPRMEAPARATRSYLCPRLCSISLPLCIKLHLPLYLARMYGSWIKSSSMDGGWMGMEMEMIERW